jgi:hypothetical protein
MATEYVDAGTAIPYAALSMSPGKAPPAAKGVTYERILNARDEPQNWLTYYGAGFDAGSEPPSACRGAVPSLIMLQTIVANQDNFALAA